LKSVVLDRKGDAIRYHPTILALAAHYHFEPRPVAVARGNEKGRVERSIRIVRESFFAGRKWTDLGDLNRQAEEWVPGTGPRVAVARYRAHASPQEGNSSQAG
jgi:transposase